MAKVKPIIVRLDEDLVDELDQLGVEIGLSRTDTVEALLEVALERVEAKEWDIQKIARAFRREVAKDKTVK